MKTNLAAHRIAECDLGHSCLIPPVEIPGFRRLHRKIAQNPLLLSKRSHVIIPVGNLKVGPFVKEKPDVLQGTLALMLLKTLDILGPQYGYAEDLP